jgi:type III pantothenate kinase
MSLNLNLLLINIGNTRTQVGTFRDDKIHNPESISHTAPQRELEKLLAESFAEVSQNTNVMVLLSSVNTRARQVVQETLRTIKAQPVVVLEEDIKVPVGRQLDPETIVGTDRLLNAAAAFGHMNQSCVVVDAGTAVTIDYVDGVGTFHGGAIGPGAKMMLQSMHQHAEQLPDVTFEKPDEPIGHNTAQAMRSAVFYGIRGMVRELVEQYALQAGAYPIVVATGGDAEVLFKDYDLVEHIVPELTLLGMVQAVKAQMKSDD